jgi:CheY-like chemotaxis protein
MLGYEVAVARDGREALVTLRSGRPLDLLFSDIVMPNGVSGIELAQEARALTPALKVLLTSGYSQPEALTGEALDADIAILPKPYRRGDVEDRLRGLLGRQGA